MYSAHIQAPWLEAASILDLRFQPCIWHSHKITNFAAWHAVHCLSNNQYLSVGSYSIQGIIPFCVFFFYDWILMTYILSKCTISLNHKKVFHSCGGPHRSHKIKMWANSTQNYCKYFFLVTCIWSKHMWGL